jgi:coenzyme F420-0:L-glutamate ligase
VSELRVIPVTGLPEVRPGDDLAALLASAASFEEGDVLVVSHKVVSKAEGRFVTGQDKLDVVLAESVRIVRRRGDLVIAETSHGFVCASAGVDASNVPESGALVLLPVDPDASARGLHEALGVAVIVSDSFGRPWRRGTTDVAIGVAGLEPLLDLRGTRDAAGYELRTTEIAVADEIAAAAELVKGKAAGVPAAIVRGLAPTGDGSARDLLMPAERDLFR